MEKIYPNLIKSDRKELEGFLNKHDLKYEDNIESSYLIREGGLIIGTGSRYQNIIKCLAIDDSYKGGYLINEILSLLINEIYAEGFDNVFLYTKAQYRQTFEFLGFNLIEKVEPFLVFMERSHNFESYLKTLEKEKTSSRDAGAIVMNANPFTLGHRYLVEYALDYCDFLYIFVVSEDLSFFTTKERVKLIQEGTKDLDRVKILPTENYLVSAATFPSYFIKKEDDLSQIHTRLDSRIFKNHIGRVLGVKKRFVGEEREDKLTNLYNRIMKEELEKEPNPIKLIEIPRKTINGKAVSASRVRAAIKAGDFKSLEAYLPPSSLSYILEKYGQK